MKIKIIIDKTKPEEIQIFAHERNELINEIERLVSADSTDLTGYINNEAIKLSLCEINCFICENNKVFALTDKKFLIKLRLYQIEEMLDDRFIKINQSCIANIRQIEKVQATYSGAFAVIFRNGYKDYISRRNIKRVKERLGVRL